MPTRARRHQLTSSLVFHAYNRSNNSVSIFQTAGDGAHFMHLLTMYSEVFVLKIYHWAIMRTHFHLLLEMPDPRQISSFMAGLNRAYTHYHHKVYEASGLLWQGRFGLQPIQKERYLAACGRYIERNPVRANLVRYAEEYHFSSARYYCLGFQDGITAEDPLFAGFGNNESVRRLSYTHFLRDFDKDEESLFRNGNTLIGDEHFMARIGRINGRYLPRGRGCAPGTNFNAMHCQ